MTETSLSYWQMAKERHVAKSPGEILATLFFGAFTLAGFLLARTFTVIALVFSSTWLAFSYGMAKGGKPKKTESNPQSTFWEK